MADLKDIKSNLEDSAESAQEAVADGVDMARKRFQKLGDQAQDHYKRVSEQVQDRYKKVSHDVRRGAERASRRSAAAPTGPARPMATWRRTPEKTYAQVRSQAGSLSREVSLYVRDNPAKSVMIAAGVGFLLGLIVCRGSRDDEG